MKQVRWVQRLVILAGVFYTLTGIALLIAPTWFYANIGNFAPFNRHYMGDLGSFLLPMGIGLLLAARQPRRHYLLIAVIAAGNIMHAINHIYDAILGNGDWAYWLSDTIPLIFFAIIFLWTMKIGDWKLQSPISNP